MNFRLPVIAFFMCSLTMGVFAQDLFVQPAPPPAFSQPSPPANPSEPQQPAPVTDAQLLQKIIEDQLAAIRSFDVSRAYYAYTTREFQKTVSLETFKQFVKKYSVFFRNKQVTKEDVVFARNTADYKGKFLSLDGDVNTVLIHFINVDDEWKIDSIQLEDLPAAPRRTSK